MQPQALLLLLSLRRTRQLPEPNLIRPISAVPHSAPPQSRLPRHRRNPACAAKTGQAGPNPKKHTGRHQSPFLRKHPPVFRHHAPPAGSLQTVPPGMGFIFRRNFCRRSAYRPKHPKPGTLLLPGSNRPFQTFRPGTKPSLLHLNIRPPGQALQNHPSPRPAQSLAPRRNTGPGTNHTVAAQPKHTLLYRTKLPANPFRKSRQSSRRTYRLQLAEHLPP